jgi:hypothetical protein
LEIRLEIDEFEFRNERLEGFYTEHPKPAGLAVRPMLAVDDVEALRVEAEGYLRRPPRTGDKFCYEPDSLEDMNRERIMACRRTVEQERPDWVEAIKDAARIANDTIFIIAYSCVPPYPAVAILENLRDRGELPSED